MSWLYSQVDLSDLNILITVCSIAVAYFYKSVSYVASREPATAIKKVLLEIQHRHSIPYEKQCSQIVVAIFTRGLFGSEYINNGMWYGGRIFFKSHFPTKLAESRQPLFKRTFSKYSTVIQFLTTNNAVNLSGLYSQMDFFALNILITVCSIAVAYF